MSEYVDEFIALIRNDDPLSKGPALRLGLIIMFAAIAVLCICFAFIPMLKYTLVTPSVSPGWYGRDYDADQNTRGSLTDLINTGTSGITLDTPMTQLSVATANYGGIYTEDSGFFGLNPWIGHVDPDVVRLQIEAGARAVVFDIWPDPANPAIPVVCAMKDSNEWGSISWWRNNGINKGVGKYSNWQLLTRNKVPATDMINMACTTAFGALAPNVQTNDPFFLILRLHGAMTVDYLNYLGNAVKAALGTHRMPTQWDKMQNQSAICSAKVSDFMQSGFVIVSPDIQPSYNILPNTNTMDGFITLYRNTVMGEVTNALDTTVNPVFFDLGTLDAIASATQPACASGQGSQTPAQAGFCVVQPTIGGKTSDNTKQIGLSNFQKARQVGAQMVAVNYFSQNNGDDVMTAVFDPALFGKYSFKKGA